MRLDKYLKVSRLVKRRTVANELCDAKHIDVNGKTARASYEVKIARLGDFSISMATAGGVSLSEVNKKTCESKIHAGLFFAGEVLDIDGDTGGYNLQAAFSTAYLAAQRMKTLCA